VNSVAWVLVVGILGLVAFKVIGDRTQEIIAAERGVPESAIAAGQNIAMGIINLIGGSAPVATSSGGGDRKRPL